MFYQYLKKLCNCHFILASQSPRRLAILTDLGLQFDAVSSGFKEDLDPSKFKSPSEYVLETARKKAEAVAQALPDKKKDVSLIVSADTIVLLESEIIGKPASLSDAKSILEKLSGKNHKVLTGVVLLYACSSISGVNFKSKSFVEETEVKMSELTEDVMNSYLETEEYVDKAGGYAIQGYGATLIEGIKGDFYNVVGFPVNRFSKELLLLCEEGVFWS